MTERHATNPFGDGYLEIPATGVVIPSPPPEYPRFRTILGARVSVQCADCGGAADLIFFWTLPAQPYCPACWDKVGHFDPARGVLARKDASGIWRPTSQVGTIRADPYDFDW